MKNSLTAVILAKNEEEMISNCLETLSWVDHLLVINNGSTDATAEIAENFGAQVVHFEHSSFARLRNEALKHLDSDWVMYIDPDERIVPTLAKEIMVRLETEEADALIFNRKNICYGQEFNYGGWEQDKVTRVFRTKKLKHWQGRVHETAVFEGEALELKTPLIHLTHRSTTDNLKKTIKWTKIEAEELFKADAAPVNFFTLIRKGLMEFIRRAFIKKGYKDGLAGMIEALVQGINKILIYIQVWELQQNPSLEEQYRQHELDVVKKWQQEDINQWKENK